MRARGRGGGGGETERQRLRTMFASPITAVPPIDDTQKVANWETELQTFSVDGARVQKG